jgi:hypothetical protein
MRSISIIAALLLSMCTINTFAQDNTLSKKEQKSGWKLLFDGKTTTGWRNFNSNSIGKAWKVQDGAL